MRNILYILIYVYFCTNTVYLALYLSSLLISLGSENIFFVCFFNNWKPAFLLSHSETHKRLLIFYKHDTFLHQRKAKLGLSLLIEHCESSRRFALMWSLKWTLFIYSSSSFCLWWCLLVTLKPKCSLSLPVTDGVTTLHTQMVDFNLRRISPVVAQVLAFEMVTSKINISLWKHWCLWTNCQQKKVKNSRLHGCSPTICHSPFTVPAHVLRLDIFIFISQNVRWKKVSFDDVDFSGGASRTP